MTLLTRKATIDSGLRSAVPYNLALDQRLKDLLYANLIRECPTPTAKTGDATLTVAELLSYIITATKATAVALTLPLGSDVDATFSDLTLSADQGFEWSVINLGSSTGAVTMTANTGHTYVGAAVLAIATSARFVTRKTAASTFITYRIS